MRKTQSKATRIRKFMLKNPKATAKQIADAVGVGVAYVYAVQHKQRAQRAKEATKLVAEWREVKSLKKPQDWKTVATILSNTPAQHTDNVNHPAHYKTGGIETIDFIEAKGLNYRLGNVVKYITRADHKGDRLENLKKAQWYLNREIDKAQGV